MQATGNLLPSEPTSALLVLLPRRPPLPPAAPPRHRLPPPFADHPASTLPSCRLLQRCEAFLSQHQRVVTPLLPAVRSFAQGSTSGRHADPLRQVFIRDAWPQALKLIPALPSVCALALHTCRLVEQHREWPVQQRFRLAAAAAGAAHAAAQLLRWLAVPLPAFPRRERHEVASAYLKVRQ